MPLGHLERPARRRGAILVLVLWVVVVLSLIYYSLMDELVLDTRLTALQKADMQAFHAARVGVARAVADLTNDIVVDLSAEVEPFDSIGEVWAKDDKLVDVPVAKDSDDRPFEMTYTVLIEDENSKINVNFASYELILALLQVLEHEGIGEEREQELKDTAAAIWDWRDPDTRPKQGMGQEESQYYAQRQREKEHGRIRDGLYIYISKNDRFTSLEELLDVYGVTPELFYGYDVRDRRRSRGRRGARFRVKRPDGSVVGERRGLRDFLTVQTPNGRINVNTAPAEVLAAIAVAEGRTLSDAIALAETACAERAGLRGANTTNAHRNLREFHAKTKFPTPRRARVALDVRSRVFRITSLGEVSTRNRGRRYRGKPRRRAAHSVQVIVDRQVNFYNLNPPIGDVKGIWQEMDPGPPYYKMVRVAHNRPNETYDPVVRVRQWVEW